VKAEGIALLFPANLLLLPLPRHLVEPALVPFQKHTFYGFCLFNFLTGKWNKSVGFWWGLQQVRTVKSKNAQAGAGVIEKREPLKRDGKLVLSTKLQTCSLLSGTVKTHFHFH